MTQTLHYTVLHISVQYKYEDTTSFVPYKVTMIIVFSLASVIKTINFVSPAFNNSFSRQ